MESPELYCKYLNLKVPRKEWFCNRLTKNNNITCTQCNYSSEIITGRQKEMIKMGYGVETTTKYGEILVIRNDKPIK